MWSYPITQRNGSQQLLICTGYHLSFRELRHFPPYLKQYNITLVIFFWEIQLLCQTVIRFSSDQTHRLGIIFSCLNPSQEKKRWSTHKPSLAIFTLSKYYCTIMKNVLGRFFILGFFPLRYDAILLSHSLWLKTKSNIFCKKM